MKKTGSTMEFHNERNAALQRAFMAAWRQASEVSIMPTVKEITTKAARMPADRFWVSEERALTVVSQMLRGLPVLKTMRGPKRRMFEEIHRRVVKMKAERPAATLTDIIAEVVYQPAPEFYMQPNTVKFLVNRAKQERRRNGRG